MVNTFFVVEDDPKASAACLDRQRLGKQRVEAYQILNNLDDLRFLADYLGLEPFPVGVDYPKDVREQWVQSVMAVVKRDLKAKYIHVDTSSSSTKNKDKRVANNLTLYNVKPNISSGYIIGMGFKTHPCVTMWLGFETGLCYYINAHIDEWLSRGYKNNMATYPEAEAIFPSWCRDSEVIDSFRANLMAKEIERFEPLHYMYQQTFVDSFANDLELAERIYDVFRDYPQLQDEWHLKTQLAIDSQQYFLESCRTHVKPYLWA
jgi:hypothetical protein